MNACVQTAPKQGVQALLRTIAFSGDAPAPLVTFLATVGQKAVAYSRQHHALA